MRRLFTISILTLLLGTTALAGLDPSYSEDATIDTVPFFPGGTYDESIPHPNEYLQHPLGQWPLRYFELVPYLEDMAAASNRLILEEHAVSHEGRQLYNMFISSPENLQRREEIRQQLAQVADPGSDLTAAEREQLINELPAVAWLGYSIHGDEISGVDAAVQLIYQMAAGTDDATQQILDNVIIIVDPIENPDGRERYLSMLQTYKSQVPNYNRYAMQHRGVWPWGRANHYLFDLNRDWILLTQPETWGKVKTITKWHPQMVVDAHEMGSNATFLFSPPRQPINYNTAPNIMKWYDVFAADQSAAFDQRGWTYYTGEWNDQWYPGYGSAWTTFFGAVGILYEMAGVDGMFVKQSDDYLLTYHEAVNKQFTSSFTNLTTLAANREAILQDYYDGRAEIVQMGRQSGLKFIIVPDGDEIKTQRFIERLAGLDIEVQQATGEFTAANVRDIYGDESNSMKFPAGTYVVSTAQPHGSLAKAILEFDPRLKKSFLDEERRELEKYGSTKMYEVSTWSLPLAYDMDAYATNARINADFETVVDVPLSGGQLHNPDATVGFIADHVGEKTYLLLSRAFGKDVVVHASEKPFAIEGRSYDAGALFFRKRGNRSDLVDILSELAEDVGIDIYGVNTGASSEGSKLGAPTFNLLSKPKVAIVAGDGIGYTSYGTLWFTIDHEIGYPHSIVNIGDLGSSALNMFNVLVLPGSWGPMSSHLSDGAKRNISDWVSDGGTLVVMGQSAVWAADSSTGLSNVALFRQSLDKLDEYMEAADRELLAEDPEVDTLALWYPEKVPAEEEPEEQPAGMQISEDDDRWLRRFMPRGVMLRAELDNDDWLAFGMKDAVPVMTYTSSAFLTKPPVKTVGRFAAHNDVRMSGLLWPEARKRWANTAYLTRERKGSGQIIMFATDPNMRAYFFGTRKLFLNALLYGPGMGTRFEGPYEN